MMWRHNDYNMDKYVLSGEGAIEQLGNHGRRVIRAVEVIKLDPDTFFPMNALVDCWAIFVFKDYRSTLRSHATFPHWRKTIHSIELLTSYI